MAQTVCLVQLECGHTHLASETTGRALPKAQGEIFMISQPSIGKRCHIVSSVGEVFTSTVQEIRSLPLGKESYYLRVRTHNSILSLICVAQAEPLPETIRS